MSLSDRPSSHSVASVDIQRLLEFSSKKSSLFRFLFAAVFILWSLSSSAARPGSRKMQVAIERKQEFKDNYTTTSSMLTSRDPSLTSSNSNRFTREPKNFKTTKKTKRISEEKKAMDTREAACKRLWHPQPATDELLKVAMGHSDAVEDHCSAEQFPGCFPVPVVLHIRNMCSSFPADISDFDRLKTFVMRCPSTPCCETSSSCRVKSSIEFNQTFKVSHLGEKKVVTIPLRNDTECECGTTTCPSKCPKPFKPTRDRHKCECTCHQKSEDERRKCEEIKDGRQPLKDSEKRCVEESRCRHPLCSADRRYDIQTGLCISACSV